MNNTPQTCEESGEGATLALLTRSDVVLIGRAVRGRWLVSEEERHEAVEQLFVTLQSDDVRLVLSVVRVLLMMEEQNQRAEHGEF